jgi:hypothetical protein
MRRLVIALTAALLAVTPAYADCLTGPVAAQWTGAGDRNTEPFTTTGAPLRMIYTTAGSHGTVQICWRVRKMDSSAGPGGCIQQPEGETFIYVPAGTYYMEIKSMGEFSVTLEQTGV